MDSDADLDTDLDADLDTASSSSISRGPSVQPEGIDILPSRLVYLLTLLARVVDVKGKRFWCVEAFCGVASIVNGFRERGMEAVGFDFETVDPKDDINTSVGFVRLLGQIMLTFTGGLFFAAPRCGSWVPHIRTNTYNYTSL